MEGWASAEVSSKTVEGDKIVVVFQTENGESKKYEITEEELADPNNSKLPPLANPAILEASDDLTNRTSTHRIPRSFRQKLTCCSVISERACGVASNQITILPEGNLYIQWYCVNSNESVCSRGLPICPRNGAGLCREAESHAGSSFVCHCGGSIRVCSPGTHGWRHG